MIWQGLATFASMAALDWVFAYYTKNVIKKNAALAGLYASAIVVTNAIVTISYVTDHWMVVPAVLGAFAGTWVAVRRH